MNEEQLRRGNELKALINECNRRLELVDYRLDDNSNGISIMSRGGSYYRVVDAGDDARMILEIIKSRLKILLAKHEADLEAL